MYETVKCLLYKMFAMRGLVYNGHPVYGVLLYLKNSLKVIFIRLYFQSVILLEKENFAQLYFWTLGKFCLSDFSSARLSRLLVRFLPDLWSVGYFLCQIFCLKDLCFVRHFGQTDKMSARLMVCRIFCLSNFSLSDF